MHRAIHPTGNQLIFPVVEGAFKTRFVMTQCADIWDREDTNKVNQAIDSIDFSFNICEGGVNTGSNHFNFLDAFQKIRRLNPLCLLF